MGPDGKLHQKVIGKIDNVKDPCKDSKSAPAPQPTDRCAKAPLPFDAACIEFLGVRLTEF